MGQNQPLQFYILKAKSTYGEEEPLMMKAERLPVKRSDVTCCCWWRESHQLLMMGKKGDRCWRVVIDEDWRGSLKPWVVEEIVAAVDEKKAVTVSTDDWTLEWILEWGKRRSEDWIVTVTVTVTAFVVVGARLVN